MNKVGLSDMIRVKVEYAAIAFSVDFVPVIITDPDLKRISLNLEQST